MHAAARRDPRKAADIVSSSLTGRLAAKSAGSRKPTYCPRAKMNRSMRPIFGSGRGSQLFVLAVLSSAARSALASLIASSLAQKCMKVILGKHVAVDRRQGSARNTQMAAGSAEVARAARKSRSIDGTKYAVRAPGTVGMRTSRR
jgi:hypothetical protein